LVEGLTERLYLLARNDIAGPLRKRRWLFRRFHCFADERRGWTWAGDVMWRRYGDVPYTLLVFVVFSMEAIGLGLVIWAFSRDLFGFIPYGEAEVYLVGGVAVTAAGLAVLTGYVLAYHAMSLSRERRSQELGTMWTKRWLRALEGADSFPRPPLPREAQDAALALREVLGGAEGAELVSRLEADGVAAELVRRLESRRRTVRLEALEALARARLPQTFDSVNRYLYDSEPLVRLMAARAAARTLGAWSGPGRHEPEAAFAESLSAVDLPAGAVTEVLILLESAALGVAARLLADPRLAAPLARACLDAVGRLGLSPLAYEAGPRVSHPDPEVRAAALRAMGRIGRVPARARDAIVIALADDTEFVRVQAARAAAFVPAQNAVTALSEALGDRSWWVRRAAAESLVARDAWGIDALKRAAVSHPDPYARDMSAQVLMDAGIELPAEAIELRGTA
jgi:HEAT repeat protein